MIALIDADIVGYRCAASCEPNKEKLEREPLDLAIRRTDELMHRIMLDSNCDSFKAFLSGGQNFRKELYPEYKANRKRIEPPAYLQNVREFLCTDWDAKVIVGYEADDAIGIHHDRDQTVICSNDKDFLQIAGDHYNFVTLTYSSIDDEEANYHYWYQMLIGDKSDNVPGIIGYQAYKTAEKILTSMPADEWPRHIQNMYGDDEWFYRNRTLLRILRSEDEYDLIRKALDEDSYNEELSPHVTINS